MGCTREEQMRWLNEVWEAATRARTNGIDVRAVTTWALLGSFDWNSLVTRETDYYEPGAYDVRGPVPRPTALASMVRALATDGRFEHPVLATPGWWNRRQSTLNRDATRIVARPILIICDSNERWRDLAKACDLRGLVHATVDPYDFDAGSAEDLARVLDQHRPWAVIDAAGSAEALSEVCERRGIAFTTYSPHDPDASATLDALLDDSCRYAESPESSRAVA